MPDSTGIWWRPPSGGPDYGMRWGPPSGGPDWHLANGRPTGILRCAAKLLFNPQQLVVLGHTIAATRGTGLDLTGRRPDGEIGDRGVLGLPGTVGNDCSVPRSARYCDRVQRFRNGADLIELHKQRIADVIGDASLQDLRIGDEHIVAHQLYPIAERRRQRLPPFPVALSPPVFDRDNE